MTIVRGYIVPSIQPRTGSTNPPLISTASLPPAEVGAAYSFQMSAVNGVPPYSWSISASSPDTTMGITSAGLIQWTPKASANPQETVNIRVTDSVAAPTAPTQFSLTVFPQLLITTTSLPSGNAGTPYSATLTATGGSPPYTWSITGQNAAGFPALNAATGVLSGTPTTGQSLTIGASVTDSLGVKVTQSFGLFVQGASGAALGPQRIFVGTVTDVQATLQLWPPSTGDADSYNFYRRDSLNNVIKVNATPVVPVVPPSGNVPQIFISDTSAAPNNLLPSTTYTYWGTAVTGGVESQPGPIIQVTTLAPGPGSTLPTPAIDPATYILPPPASYTNFYNNTNVTPISTTAALQTAIAATGGAQPGQTVVLQAGVAFTSGSGDPSFVFACSGTAAAPINFITSQDPVLNSSGALPPYSGDTSQPRFVSFTLATLPPASTPAAPTLTATLTKTWAGRTGYYPTIFYTSAPPGYEMRLVHYINGSSAISWEAGYNGIAGSVTKGGGGLIGAVTSATLLVHQNTFVTWDDRGAMPQLQSSFPTSGTAVQVTGDYLRFVGIQMGPVPGRAVNQCGTACLSVAQSADHITFDRCIIGNDTGQSTWSPMTRCVSQAGTNIAWHQCFIFGASIGMPGSLSNVQTSQDCQGIYLTAQGPACIENCYVEGTSETVFFGGATYTGENVVVNNCTLQRSFVCKNGAWNQTDFGANIKNLIESKTSQQIHVHDNILCGSWSAFNTAGQRGMGMNLGPIDQVATSTTHPINTLAWDATNGGQITGTGTFWGAGTTVGQTVTCTIAGCTPAGYNGTFLLTITAKPTDGSGASFSTPMSTNPGPATVKGTVTTNPVMINPWARVTDWDVHDNQIYGVGVGVNMHKDDGHQVTAHAARMRFFNNLCWMNPLGAGSVHVGVIFTAVPTATGGTASYNYYGHNNTVYPLPVIGNPNNAGGVIDLLDSNGNVVQTITVATTSSTTGAITWASTTINPAATVNATIRTHEGLTAVIGFIEEPPVPDAIVQHNTFIMPPNGTGYVTTDTTAINKPSSSQYFTVANPPITARRHTVTDNVMDGVQGIFVTNNKIAAPGGSAGLAFATTAVAWSNNAFILDTTTGWPTPFWNPNSTPPVTYANLFGTFAGNTVFPADPSVVNVDQAPYNTDSTTGSPIGSIFPSPAQFPLLGAYLEGGIIDPGTVAHIGAMDAIILSGYDAQPAGQLQGFVANAKAANPAMVVTAYVKTNSQVPSTTGFQKEITQMNAANWWVRAAFPAGAIGTEFSGSEQAVNIIQSRTSTNLPFPGAAAGARTVRQWMAQYAVHYFGTGAATNLDGMFTDNFYFQPRAITGGQSQADWTETGSAQSDSATNTVTAWRSAYADWDTQIRAAMGSNYHQHWGNSADWGSASGQIYAGLLNGGVIESQEQEEALASWAQMMAFYKATMISMVPASDGRGPFPIFEWQSATTNNFAAARYAICSCLLDNGYFYWNDGNNNKITWFDELAFNLGGALPGPNNPTNGTYSNGGLTVWKQGVWRRDFANGIALVNPRGNGAQTITLETTYWHLRQSVDTDGVNNATAVTSVTLPDPKVAGTGGSGLILSRTAT